MNDVLPNVFVIDDDEKEWHPLIRQNLRPIIPTISKDPTNISILKSSLWDAAVIDVTLDGFGDMDGLKFTIDAILEHEINCPFILLTSVPTLNEIRMKYGNIFYRYIHKSEYERLHDVVLEASKAITRKTYLKNLTSEFVKKFNLNDELIPESLLDHPGMDRYFPNHTNCTINDLICQVQGNNKQILHKSGLILIDIIERMRDPEQNIW